VIAGALGARLHPDDTVTNDLVTGAKVPVHELGRWTLARSMPTGDDDS
jgi:hypothetical protein